MALLNSKRVKLNGKIIKFEEARPQFYSPIEVPVDIDWGSSFSSNVFQLKANNAWENSFLEIKTHVLPPSIMVKVDTTESAIDTYIAPDTIRSLFSTCTIQPSDRNAMSSFSFLMPETKEENEATNYPVCKDVILPPPNIRAVSEFNWLFSKPEIIMDPEFSNECDEGSFDKWRMLRISLKKILKKRVRDVRYKAKLRVSVVK